MSDRLTRLGGFAVLVLMAAPLHAQRILGAGEDAVTLPRGAFRIGIAGESRMQRDGWRDGTLGGLAGTFTGPQLGAAQLSRLAGTQQLVRDLGVADFSASLGAPRLDARQRVFVTPLSIEYGLASWFTLGVRAPLVRTRTEARLTVDGDSGRANLGLNPIRLGSGVAAANLATINAYVAAANNLTSRRNACQANPGAAAECPTILAELAAVAQLATRTSQFATGLSTLYGGGAAAGQRYVPRAGSAAEAALLARVDSLRSALTRYGIGDITPTTTLPLAAQTPLTAADLDALVRDSTDGFGARDLSDGGLTAIGDLELQARIKLFDSFGPDHAERFASTGRGLRQTLVVTGRIGTGTVERPDALLDQGSGTGTDAIGLRSVTDLVWNRRAWVSVSVGAVQGFAQTRRMRVPSADDFVFLEAWREADVDVDPGLRLDAAVTPQWMLNDYLAVGASYRWRRWVADVHRTPGTAPDPDGNPIPLLASALDAATEAEEHAFGLNATFSTLAAKARGRDGLALEVSYQHLQSLASGMGVVPKRWEDRLTLRYYTRFFRR